MDPVEGPVALEAIKRVKHQYAHNLDAKQVRHNRPAIGATAGIEQQET
jgi:hypothetical protein